MCRLFICFILLLPYTALPAQNIGIGTNAPSSSALLHLNSTSKGFLMPRMSTTERNAIALPAEGLLIYNLTTNQLNQRQNGAWKILLNNDSWTGGGSGQIFNIGDNVGINTAGPSERLDVSGNIRSNGSMIIDNASAILQLKSAGISTGFVQLSGESLRIGTNSGNTTGNITLRLNGQNFFDFEGGNGTPVMHFNYANNPKGSLFINSAGNFFMSSLEANSLINLNNELYVVKPSGNVGIGITNPTTKLHVIGDSYLGGAVVVQNKLRISDQLVSLTTGIDKPLTPLCYGYVSAFGSKISGTNNFTSSTDIPDGEYYIRCSGITSNSVIVVTLRGVGNGFSMTADASCSTGECFIAIKIPNPVNPIGIDNAFNFIIY